MSDNDLPNNPEASSVTEEELRKVAQAKAEAQKLHNDALEAEQLRRNAMIKAKPVSGH